jgi:hypothetical protein
MNQASRCSPLGLQCIAQAGPLADRPRLLLAHAVQLALQVSLQSVGRAELVHHRVVELPVGAMLHDARVVDRKAYSLAQPEPEGVKMMKK